MNIIAQKVGEGFERPNAEYESPIDIKYGKLVERLLELKKLPQNWSQRLATIHASLSTAYKKLPPSVVSQVNPSGQLPLDYLMARQVRDILKETATTTLFGGLAGEAGVWDKLVTAYERQNVWLAEAGLQLQRSVDYELPYLKKSAAQCDQQLLALKRRDEDCRKAAASAAAAFKSECAALGVNGQNLLAEVSTLADALPEAVRPVLEALRTERVTHALQHYSAFASHAHEGGPVEELLPTLCAFRDGTATFSKSDRDAQPATPASPPPEAVAPDPEPANAPVLNLDWSALDLQNQDGDGEQAAASGIDWAIQPEADAAGDAIDWGIETTQEDDAQKGVVEIDWGIETEAPQGAGEAAGQGIDWDVTLEGSEAVGADAAGERAGGVAADASARQGDSGNAVRGGAGSAAGDEAPSPAVVAPPELMRFSYDSAFRARVITELYELEAFLTQRIAASQTGGGGALVTQPLPDGLEVVSVADLEAMRKEVGGALEAFSAPALRKLLLISTSRKFVRRLVRDLSMRGAQEAKMLATAKDVMTRHQEVQRQLMGIAPKQKELTDHTTRLRTSVAASTSKLLNRKVNITGEINSWV